MNRVLLSSLLLISMAAASSLEAGSQQKRESGNGYNPELRLKKLGIILPSPSSPVANYVNGVRTGNLIFLAGKGPKQADGTYIKGKVDTDLTIEEGYEAARVTAINQLAVLKAMLGDLNKVTRVERCWGWLTVIRLLQISPK
jgi:Putative translation initiation inhibitor, yjgF family